MAKDDELYGLHKIPDSALIHELRVEAGKREAYISELEDYIANQDDSIAKLEDKNKRLESAIILERNDSKIEHRKQLDLIIKNPKELREIRKDEVCKEYIAQITQLNTKVIMARRDIDMLLKRAVVLNKTINTLVTDKENLIVKLHSKNENK